MCRLVLNAGDGSGLTVEVTCPACAAGLKAASEAERLFTQDPASWRSDPEQGFFRAFPSKAVR
jgi:hypothetical protein